MGDKKVLKERSWVPFSHSISLFQ